VTPPPGIHLTGPELAQLRCCLLSVDDQAAALRGEHDRAKVAVRLEMAVAGVRFLLERAEERRGVH